MWNNTATWPAGTRFVISIDLMDNRYLRFIELKDIFSFMCIYNNGGIFNDADVKPLMPIRDWFPEEDKVLELHRWIFETVYRQSRKNSKAYLSYDKQSGVLFCNLLKNNWKMQSNNCVKVYFPVRAKSQNGMRKLRRFNDWRRTTREVVEERTGVGSTNCL